MACDNCKKSTAYDYSFCCDNCLREYCNECLKLEPTYSPDGDCVGYPPRMVDASSMPTCRWCNERECEGHADDCGVWCDERCTCAQRFDPDELLDRMKDAEMGL